MSATQDSNSFPGQVTLIALNRTDFNLEPAAPTSAVVVEPGKVAFSPSPIPARSFGLSGDFSPGQLGVLGISVYKFDSDPSKALVLWTQNGGFRQPSTKVTFIGGSDPVNAELVKTIYEDDKIGPEASGTIENHWHQAIQVYVTSELDVNAHTAKYTLSVLDDKAAEEK